MIHNDPWAFLRTHTAARIAQGRTGHSLPTRALLNFQLDHACARDAVYSQLDTETLCNQLDQVQAGALRLHSQAADRRQFLQRPDLGRRLDARSAELIRASAGQHSDVSLSLVLADGLSATAVNRHALPVLAGLVAESQRVGWRLVPLCLVEQGRVAIGDEIAHGLGADLVVVLIGERPGLSSPDSLGAYLTYRPRPGLTDESRNCVSNIRPEGLPYDFAVRKLMYLLTEMSIRRLSGVDLKDEMPMHTLPDISSRAVSAQTPETPD